MVLSVAATTPLESPFSGRSPASGAGAHEGHTHTRIEEQAKALQPGAEEAQQAGDLTAEEEAVVAELQQTDREVRAHEQAHVAAAGGLARGVSFSYATGPDGKQYAVAGEVSIDSSPAADPERTIQKAQQIRAAANAPANPSGQDRQVAAAASQMEATARAELAQKQREDVDQQYRQQEDDNAGSESARLVNLLI